MNTGIVILAAGSSSRMGRPKQMLDIKGEKLLIRTIQTVLNSGISSVVVVLGSDESFHRDLIKDLPVDIAHNPDWEKGMGSSIKAGLEHLTSLHPSIDAIIISVCDQALLSEQALTNLVKEFQKAGKPIVASGYSGVQGVPVLFHKSYFQKLKNLADDEGAKKIILQNSSDVSVVPFPGGEIDLDTMEDYERFVRES